MQQKIVGQQHIYYATYKNRFHAEFDDDIWFQKVQGRIDVNGYKDIKSFDLFEMRVQVQKLSEKHISIHTSILNKKNLIISFLCLRRLLIR